MQSKLREHPPVIWQCKHCGIWWGSEGDDATAPGLLNEATDDPDDPNDLEWEAYRGWMALAVAMGFVMTRVILTVLFYGMFTPIALVMKLLRKDPLHERFDKQAETYWVKREPHTYEPQSSERMF
ncbi:hypothetical protein HUU05_18590 [candidate division KSB1 bacterium]|nr:hypothetical protein [candidate division KSB1 bacterium]